MENKEFDDIIRRKLESLSSRGSDTGWEVFREKWQNSTVENDVPEVVEDNVDDIFDAKLKKNLQNLRMPFNSAHWIRLKIQLEAEALFKKRLFVAKTVEILMLALIVVGILNIWPIQTDRYQIPVDDSPMVASVPVDKATAEKYYAEESEKVAESVRVLRTNFNDDKVVQQISKYLPSVSVLKESVGIEFPSKISASIKSKSFENGSKVEKSKKVDLKEILPFLEAIHNDDNNQVKKRNDKIFAGLESEKASEISLPIRATGFPDVSVPLKAKQIEENSYLSVSIGPRIALINSPFDPVYEIDPYSTFNTNFNISAKLSKEIGPVEIYTGLGYTSLDYKPLIVKETYTANSSQLGKTSLDNIKFKSVNIPIGVKYDIIDKSSIQVYAAAGIDVNIIAESDFEVTELNFDNRFGPAPVTDRFNGNSSKVNSNSLLSQKEFNPGVLSGGSLGDNLYASAHVGLGLATNVSKDISLFIEPKYNHFISSQGIGPNQDKVHGASIDFGVRYQLN